MFLFFISVFFFHFALFICPFTHKPQIYTQNMNECSGSPRTGDLSTSQSSQDSSTLPITSEVEVHSDNGNNGERAADG